MYYLIFINFQEYAFMQQPMVAPSTVTALPANVAQAATNTRLGNLNATYKPRISNPLVIIAISGGIALLALILTVVVFIASGYIYFLFPAAFVAAIILGILGLVRSGHRFYEFVDGMIFANGSQLNVLRWDQIAAIWQYSRRRGYYGGLAGLAVRAALRNTSNIITTYTIQRYDGSKMTFSTTQARNLSNLGQTIQHEVARIHGPQATAAFDAGQVVPFGPLALSTQGIQSQRGILPFNQLASMQAVSGRLVFKQAPKSSTWTSVPISQIPNFTVFTDLVNYARRQGR
jgi:hypothetical protein